MQSQKFKQSEQTAKKKGEELKFFRRICRGVHSSHSCVCSGIYSSYTLYSWRKNSVWRAIAMSSAIYVLHEWSRTKEAAEANSRKNITNTIGKRQLNNNTTRNIIKKEENRTIYDWNKTKKKKLKREDQQQKKAFFRISWSDALCWLLAMDREHALLHVNPKNRDEMMEIMAEEARVCKSEESQ